MRKSKAEPPFQLNTPLPLPDNGPVPRAPMNPAVKPLIVLLVLVVGFFAYLFLSPHGTANGGIVNADGSVVASFAEDTPTLHQVTKSERLLPPVTAPAGAGGFAFTGVARWDPCRSIHYVVSGTPPFAGAERMLAAALDEASRVTGLSFVAEGTTEEVPSADREPFQPATYGDRWAPVLIAWSDPETVPELADDVSGVGGAAAARLRGDKALVSGLVFLDGPQLADYVDTAEGRAAVRATILHELGHLVGLDHVKATTSLMNARQRSGGPTDYSTADLRGLARAGSGPCMAYTARD